MLNRSNVVGCTAVKRNGERCRAIAGASGLCAAHRDPARMRDLGRRGGQARTRNVDDAVAASDLGRARLVELSQHEDPKVAIAASRALFSYGPQKPPADEPEGIDGLTMGADRSARMPEVLKVLIASGAFARWL